MATTGFSRRHVTIVLGVLAVFPITPAVQADDLDAIPPELQNATPEELHQILVGASDIVNKTLPSAVDKTTTLIHTSVGFDNTFTYNFTLDDYNRISDYGMMKLRVTNGYCTGPNFDMFRRYNVTMDWIYYSKDGKFLQKFVTTNADCR